MPAIRRRKEPVSYTHLDVYKRQHVHDAVGVDVEGDLDLRDATRSRSDAGQLEGAQRLVVASELALTLVAVSYTHLSHLSVGARPLNGHVLGVTQYGARIFALLILKLATRCV